MNKKIILIILAVIVIAGVIYLAKKNPQTQTPAEDTAGDTVESVTPESVNADLDSVDTKDVEGELQGVDEELKKL